MGKFAKNSMAEQMEWLKYLVMRDESRSIALEELREALPSEGSLLSLVSLSEVEDADLEYIDLAWNDRKVNWDWAEQLEITKKNPANWNCALRLQVNQGDREGPYELIALSVGSLSNTKIILRVEGLERKPDLDKNSYTWLTALMERAWYNYALSLDCKKITLMYPHKLLIEKYKALGYTVEEGKSSEDLLGLSKPLDKE